MTIQEAVRSGKVFFRRGDPDEFYPSSFDASEGSYSFTYAELLADDWEIEEKKVEVTREQLAKAWNNHCAGCLIANSSKSFDNFCKELGL